MVAALPSVMIDLEIPLTDLDKASWIVTGYLISYTVAMPLAGRLSDVYGRVRMFQAALLLFAIGSALVAIAPNFEWIVGARVLRAAGGGATVPIGLAMAVGAVARATRRCTWPRGRLGRGRLRAGAPLWGRHHRVDRLAVDILAGRPPELDADRAAGHSAEPRQHRGEDGLPGGDRAGWGTDRAHDRAVAAEHLLAGVLRPLSAARHRPPAGRRVDRGRETGGPATARVVPVPLQGVPRVQHHAVPRGGRADYLAGRGAPHVRHGHGEGGLGERAPPDPPDGRHTGWGRWSRVTSSDARACGR